MYRILKSHEELKAELETKNDKAVEKAYECGKENESLKVLDKVNKMAEDGASVYDIQMYLYNNWVKKFDPNAVLEEYEK